MAAQENVESGEANKVLGVEEWLERIQPALSSIRENIPEGVRLVAVSKTKPVEALEAAYRSEQRIFGENYVQEIVEKAQTPSIKKLTDIKFHFIGRLQSNKVGLLIRNVRQLAMIETIDTIKLATKVDNIVMAAINDGLRDPGKLSVMIQVNSSGEPQKGGVESIVDAISLSQHIISSCPNLNLVGFMTIGNADYTAGPENFDYLKQCREEVLSNIAKATLDDQPLSNPPSLELSMGMSGDYLIAVDHGSTSVRVGSSIFGSRTYKN